MARSLRTHRVIALMPQPIPQTISKIAASRASTKLIAELRHGCDRHTRSEKPRLVRIQAKKRAFVGEAEAGIRPVPTP